jgi:hypothetical protein
VVRQPIEMRLTVAQLFFDAQTVGDIPGHLDDAVEFPLAVAKRRNLEFKGIIDAVAVIGVMDEFGLPLPALTSTTGQGNGDPGRATSGPAEQVVTFLTLEVVDFAVAATSWAAA